MIDVMKGHPLTVESQFYESSGTMPVLANVEVSEVGIVAVFVVLTLSVQHQHTVCILLDRAGVA